MIVIVDYGMGNIGSIVNMLKHIGVDVEVSNNADEIKKADKLILPGVGAFDRAIENLNQLNLIDVLNDTVINNKTPILGICLGMQLMTQSSEEGKLDGLGWFDAKTYRFNFDSEKLKVPHMRWNTVRSDEFPLFEQLDDEARFYFVHSYYVSSENNQLKKAVTTYGQEFISAIAHDHIMGVQFHPEKSHKFGMRLLENFARMY